MPSLRRRTSNWGLKGQLPLLQRRNLPGEEQQRTFEKALVVAEQLATMKAKYITSEWYPFYHVYVPDSPFNDNIWSPGGNS